MANIIVKRYEHFNNAMGCHVTSRAHYEKLMHERGFISKDKADHIAEQVRNSKKVDNYDKLTPQAMELLNSVNKKKNGKISLSDRQVDGLKKLGAQLNVPDWCPKAYKETGGFNE